MIELELLERAEGPIALLGECELAAAHRVGLIEEVALRVGLMQIRKRDRNDACGSEQTGENERERHRVSAAPASP